MGCGCGGASTLITSGSQAPAGASPDLRTETLPNGDGLYWTGPDKPQRPSK